MPNTNFQTVHQFGAGISQVVRQATGRDPVQNIDMEHVSVAWAKRLRIVDTYTGNPVTISDGKAGEIIGAEVGMWVKQNLNGQDYPWPAGCGVNLIDQRRMLEAEGWNIDDNGYYYGSRMAMNDLTASGYPGSPIFKVNTTYTFSAMIYNENGEGTTFITFYYTDNTRRSITSNNTSPELLTLSSDSGKTVARMGISYGTIGSGIVYIKDLQLVEGGNAPYSPYENICPITPWESVLITVNDDDHQTDFPQPIYIGYFNTLTGELKITNGLATVGELSWAHEHIEDVSGGHERFNSPSLRNVMQHDSVAYRIPLSCSAYKAQFAVPPITPPFSIVDYSIWSGGGTVNPIYITDNRFTTATQFKREMGDTQICYPLANPIILQLDKEEIPAAEGENTVSTNANTLTVTLYEAV